MSQFMHLKAPKKDFKIITIVIFLLILGILVLTSFYGINFTGSVINDLISNRNSSIEIRADLTIPELELDGKFGEIKIKGGSKSNLYVGDQKFYLGDSQNNFITLKDFDGKIILDAGKILFFKGKATEVSVNGIPITSNMGTTLKISLDEDFRYSLWEIRKGVEIKELNYITTGTLRINNDKNILRDENEEIEMNDFNGDIIISNDKFKLEGTLNKLKIKGNYGISIN